MNSGEIEELDEDEDSDKGEEEMTSNEILELCTKLEKACLSRGDPGQSFVLAQELRRFKVALSRETMLKSKQPTLDEYFMVKVKD